MTSVTYPTGETASNGYNGRGMPSTVSGSVAGSLVTGALYNQLGQASQIDLGNGLRSVFNYHGIDSVDSGDATSYWGKLYRARTYKVSDGTDRLHLKQWWDAAGNLASRTDVMASETESFSYDFLDRLTSASTGPSQGLVGWWKLDEGSGATAADSAGSNNGTLINGASWTDGKFGKGVQVDGVNDSVYVTNPSSLYDMTAFTTSVWVKPTRVASSANQAIVSMGYFHLFLDVNGVLGSGFNDTMCSSGITVSAGTWYQAAVTYDGSNLRVYVDGVLKNTCAMSTSSGHNNLAMGTDAGQGQAFQGVVDEVRMYNRALSATEVQSLAASGSYTESYSYSAIGNLTGKNGVSYTYGSKPHAVTAVGGTSYAYDSNGSMTSRGGTTLTWDVENRVTGVGSDSYGGACPEQRRRDGDGNRVKKVEGGSTVHYVNRYYEKNVTSGEVTTYYYLGDRLVALRKGSTLEYVHQDHRYGFSRR